jgi:hypothetical protein
MGIQHRDVVEQGDGAGGLADKNPTDRLLSARIPRCQDDATQRSTAVFVPMAEIDGRK